MKDLFVKELEDAIDLIRKTLDRTDKGDSWGSGRCTQQIRYLTIAKKRIEGAMEIAKLVRTQK